MKNQLVFQTICLSVLSELAWFHVAASVFFAGSFPDPGQHFHECLGNDRTRFTANGIHNKEDTT